MALLWDDRLVGWLVFLRMQDPEHSVAMPEVVRVALASKGWIKFDGTEDPLEGRDYSLTDEGLKVSDLYAAEWGVDSLAGCEDPT